MATSLFHIEGIEIILRQERDVTRTRDDGFVDLYDGEIGRLEIEETTFVRNIDAGNDVPAVCGHGKRKRRLDRTCWESDRPMFPYVLPGRTEK